MGNLLVGKVFKDVTEVDHLGIVKFAGTGEIGQGPDDVGMYLFVFRDIHVDPSISVELPTSNVEFHHPNIARTMATIQTSMDTMITSPIKRIQHNSPYLINQSRKESREVEADSLRLKP